MADFNCNFQYFVPNNTESISASSANHNQKLQLYQSYFARERSHLMQIMEYQETDIENLKSQVNTLHTMYKNTIDTLTRKSDLEKIFLNSVIDKACQKNRFFEIVFKCLSIVYIIKMLFDCKQWFFE